MRYKLLGRSGLRVSELCLGTMTFGGAADWAADAAESRAMFDAFAEAGGTFVDTANAYTGGESERLVGEFVASDRDLFVVATKYSQGPHISKSGDSRRNMITSVEQSLRRMKLEAIDLFWVHIWDFTTPIEEVMRAFDDLVRAGKVHYVGASDTPAWEVSRGNMLADLRGWSPFVGIQVEYSLADRTAERDLLPMAKTLDVGVTAWSPLGGGMLARRYDPEAPNRRASAGRARVPDEAQQRLIAAAIDIAEAARRPPAHVALAWMRQHPRFPRIIPIVGARTASQLKESLACLDLVLDAEAMARLDAASEPSLGVPHAMLQRDFVRGLVTGGMADRLDNHRA